MINRIGLIAIPIGLIIAYLAWRSAPPIESQQSSNPMIKLQERPGSNAWGGLSWGATVKDVTSLYPSVVSGGAFIPNLDIGGVRMSAALSYEKGHLAEVALDPSPAGCEQFDHLAALLITRYGAPDTSRVGRRAWQTKTSFVILLCGGDSQLHLVYQDRAVTGRRLRAEEADAEARLKEKSRGL